MCRLVSQTGLTYRDGPVSEGKAGDVHSGDRLPWVSASGVDNFQPLDAISWQVHVYGKARADLTDWCNVQGLQLHVFPWQPEHTKAGFAEDAAYLLRPDNYVAFADPTASPTRLSAFTNAQGLVFR